MAAIILASSSIYRKELFSRLGLDFTCFSPDINENLDITDHSCLTETLAIQKAQKAQESYPDAVCIGSDTIATLGQSRLGKPLNYEVALAQLQEMSGQEILFYTGIAIVSPDRSPLKAHVITTVQFKKLTQEMIHTYLKKEAPYKSCGSFKSETSAVALINCCQSSDPTAIVGLPLITVSQMLSDVGVSVLGG
tara:strand:+ start:235239 stop:235817 length:579 start_codon:yes stop_codon:yes gene_type:complete